MRPNGNAASYARVAWLGPPVVPACLVLLLLLAPAAWAQTDNSKPEELSKQRSALYIRATHAPPEDLGKEVNQIAISSETCRIKYGSSACGLPEKALESDKLDERYDYYVKQPVESHEKAHAVKIDRRNWVGSSTPGHP